MFGSKGATGPHTLLAALAARRLKRPVKIVLSRPQVLTDVGHRSETVQHLQVGATEGGVITAMRHHVTSHTSIDDEFAEPATLSSRMLYDIENYEAQHDLIRLNVIRPSWMRAPGEAPGNLPRRARWTNWLKSCISIRWSCGVRTTPASIRMRASRSPAIICWSATPVVQSDLAGGSDRRNRSLCGMGTFRSVGAWRQPPIRASSWELPSKFAWNASAGLRAVVQTAGSDVGTGMYTMLAITAAEELGLPLERVSVELGNSDLPQCAVAGGSNLTASTAPATTDACAEIKSELLKLRLRRQTVSQALKSTRKNLSFAMDGLPIALSRPSASGTKTCSLPQSAIRSKGKGRRSRSSDITSSTHFTLTARILSRCVSSRRSGG